MNSNKIRNVLNILLMVPALTTIAVYFATRNGFKLLIHVCGTTIFVRLTKLFIRFTNR